MTSKLQETDDEFARAVRRSLDNGTFRPIPHPDLWPENVTLDDFDLRKCTVCDKLKSEHGNAFGAPDHNYVSF